MKLRNFIFRIVYRGYRIISWLRHRTSRRVTPAGWVALTAFGAVLTTCVDSDNAVAYQALVPLLVLLLFGPFFTLFFRARFSAMRRLPRFGTVGSAVRYTVSVTNLSKRAQPGLTLLENLADPRPPFDQWLAMQLADETRLRSFRFSQGRLSNPFRLAAVKDAALPLINAGGTVEAKMELKPLRRGLLRFDGVLLARPDPFGFFRAFSKVSCPQTMLVLPRRYPVPPVALPGTMKYQEDRKSVV